MLKELRIQNFAIIDNQELRFSSGMTVLTGETGAGKTIIIDAISLLIGTRANLDMIRHGESKAVIEGVFGPISPRLQESLRELTIESEQDITISRIVSDNRSVIRINGVTITAKELKELSLDLLDIHDQHDTLRLLDPTRYLALLDEYAQTDVSTYSISYQAYKEAIHAYQQFLDQEQHANEQLEFWQFQLQELNQYGFSLEEYNELTNELAQLKNFDKLFETYQQALQAASGIENQLHSLMANAKKIQAIDESQQPLIERLSSAYYELIDGLEELGSQQQQLAFDPSRLGWIEDRLVDYDKAMRKYKQSVEGLLEKQRELSSMIANFEDAPLTKKKLQTDVEQTYQAVLRDAMAIHEHRVAAASELQLQLQTQLKDLHLPRVTFSIDVSTPKQLDPFQDTVFTVEGFDTCDILLTTNMGEPLKPLAKVASGGEMSRIMLAFKTVLLAKLGLSTIIFDEIDLGVSGEVAGAIARKIKELSTTTQVLLITHLPQVAAIADTHMLVRKEELQGRTISSAALLDEQMRIAAIAAMMSTATPTAKSIALAEELFHQYR
jgi:DNA repair protein RecN (Recombination protein N)